MGHWRCEPLVGCYGKGNGIQMDDVRDSAEGVEASRPPSCGAEVALTKRVLYFAPGRAHLKDLLRGLAAVPGCVADPLTDPPFYAFRKLHVTLVAATDVTTAVTLLHEGYFNLVIVDVRAVRGEGMTDGEVAAGLELLRAMAEEPDIEARFGFHRVMTLVSGADSDAVDQLIAELGHLGVGRVIRDRTAEAQAVGREALRLAFSKLVLHESMRMMLEKPKGKRALCAAGGGITGVYFEMGALKCLDDCLQGGAVNDFDMYFGISAGAVVTGFLANGYSVDECMAAIAGVPGGRVPISTLNLFSWDHVNFQDLRYRAGRLLRQLGISMWDLMRGRSSLSLEALALEYSDVVGAPFQTDHFESVLAEIFTLPGTTNDFRKLGCSLYIGATDQDTRTHVLFGDAGHDDIPISAAVQASMAINPAFTSARIRGRYYIDGAVTRTSNFVEAIRKGATLVLVIDPFVPYVSKEPGYARRRGLLYNIDQDVRTISYTRFENMRNELLPHFPRVSSYTFLPSNRLRALMGVNPMDHRPYLQVWRGAYLSTLRRILHLRYRMAGDMAAHGFCFDTARAEEVAARLRKAKVPQFADFFVDGRVQLRLPPLARHRAAIKQPVPTSTPTALVARTSVA